jgi:protein involved in polysaccharide export with SLBB domain
VRHKTTVELEDSIKSRIAKLLQMRSAAEDIVDVDPKEPNPKAAAAELLREDADD